MHIGWERSMTESWLKCHRSHEKSEQKHIHRKQWKTCKLSFFMFLLSDLLHDDNWSSGCVTHIGLAMGTQTFGFNRRNVKAVYHQRYDGHQINRHPKDFEQSSLPSWWFQPLWKIWKSVGMIIPNICEKNVPNHQLTISDIGSWNLNFSFPKFVHISQII